MEQQLLNLQARVNELDRSTSSSVTRQATCAVFRDVLLPMLNAELGARGILGFVSKIGISWVKGLIERYLAQNCSTPEFQKP